MLTRRQPGSGPSHRVASPLDRPGRGAAHAGQRAPGAGGALGDVPQQCGEERGRSGCEEGPGDPEQGLGSQALTRRGFWNPAGSTHLLSLEPRLALQDHSACPQRCCHPTPPGPAGGAEDDQAEPLLEGGFVVEASASTSDPWGGLHRSDSLLVSAGRTGNHFFQGSEPWRVTGPACSTFVCGAVAGRWCWAVSRADSDQ